MGLTNPAPSAPPPSLLTTDDARLFARMWSIVAEYVDGLGKGSVMLSPDIPAALEKRLRAHRSTHNQILLTTAEDAFEAMAPVSSSTMHDLRALLDAFSNDVGEGLLWTIATFRPSAADLQGTPKALDLPGFSSQLEAAMLEAVRWRVEEKRKELERDGQAGRVAAWNQTEEERRANTAAQVCLPPPSIPTVEWVFASAPMIVFVAAAAWLAVASADVVLSRGVM